jgi:hypothetical protein
MLLTQKCVEKKQVIAKTTQTLCDLVKCRASLRHLKKKKSQIVIASLRAVAGLCMAGGDRVVVIVAV